MRGSGQRTQQWGRQAGPRGRRLAAWLALVAMLAAVMAAPLPAGAQGQGQGAQTPGPQGSGAQTPGPQGSGAQTPGPQGSGAQTPGPQGSGAQTPGPQGSGAGQGQSTTGATSTPGPSRTPGTPGPDKSIEKVVIPSDGGRGSKATEAQRGSEVTYEIRVTGAPPGQRRGQLEDELRDNAPPKLDYKEGTATRNGASVAATYDGNKVVIQEEGFQDGQTIVYRLTFTVKPDAPCNHVATNVAHVNGIGSDQAQVRIVCPEGATPSTPTRTVVTGAAAASATPTATTRPDAVQVRKTLEDEEGRTVGQINSGHLGRLFKYNILIRRNGGLPGRTQMAFTDVMQPCGANSVQEFFPEIVRAEIQGGDPSDEFTYTIDGCTVEGRIAGDNKANFDASGPGNQFHVHIWVRLPAAGTRAAQNPPREVTNDVRVSVDGGPAGSDRLRTPVNLRPASSVNLPAAVPGRLVAPVEVAGVTLQPGESVQIVALPPGAVLQVPPGGGRVAVPPGGVLGITSRPELGELVVPTTPIFVDVLDVGTVRAPAPGLLPQSGTGPALGLLPQTGVTSGLALPLVAAGTALLGAMVARARRNRR